MASFSRRLDAALNSFSSSEERDEPGVPCEGGVSVDVVLVVSCEATDSLDSRRVGMATLPMVLFAEAFWLVGVWKASVGGGHGSMNTFGVMECRRLGSSFRRRTMQTPVTETRPTAAKKIMIIAAVRKVLLPSALFPRAGSSM